MTRRLAATLLCIILGAAFAAAPSRPPARVLTPPILTRVVTAPGMPRPTAPPLTDFTNKTPPAQPFTRRQLLVALTAYAGTRTALLARSTRPGGNPEFMRPLPAAQVTQPGLLSGVLLTPAAPTAGGAGWLASLQVFSMAMEEDAAKLRAALDAGVIPLRATQARDWLLSVHVVFPGPAAGPSPYAVCFGLVSDISKPLQASDFTLEFQAEQETITIPLGELPDDRGFVAIIDAPPGEGWMFLRARRPDLMMRFTYVQIMRI